MDNSWEGSQEEIFRTWASYESYRLSSIVSNLCRYDKSYVPLGSQYWVPYLGMKDATDRKISSYSFMV